MNWKIIIPRTLLGFIFFAAGLAGLLNMLPKPELGPEATQFMTGLMATGYFFPFLKGLETLAGFMLLAGFFVPLMLTVLAPIVVHIVLYHAFLAPEGLGVTVAIVFLFVFNVWNYREFYKPLSKLK